LKIVVCVKAVPGYVIEPRVSETGDRVNYKAGSIIMNESDEYALEEALALKKEFGGEVTVITAGSLSSQKALHVGLAKDADKAVRINTDFIDCGSLAKVLAETIKRLGYDLILTGVESSDNMAAQTGILIAERLGLPFAYAVTEVKRGESPGTLTVTKELGGGVKQVLEITLPALLCIQTGTTLLSYAPFRKVLQAQAKPVQSIAINELGINDELKKSPPFRIVDIFPPQRISNAEIIDGKPSEVASVLIQKVREGV